MTDTIGGMQALAPKAKVDDGLIRVYSLKEINLFNILFHLNKLRRGKFDDFLEMEIDYTWNIFRMSYSGNKAVMKKFKKISRDLYSYYGVTEKDIKNKTKRYSSLVTNLSS